ncbi:MAG: hypothetical protein IJX13_03335 [Clostridia bacterium]|nr:hypothetical protein [Clostridia bacterium]
MSQKTIERIRLLWGIVLSVLIVAVGICFIVSCITIYERGGRPFSRESVEEQFGIIAVPVYICVGAVIVGGIFSCAFPQTTRVTAKNNEKKQLERLYRRIDIASAQPEVLAHIKKERFLRFFLGAANAVLCVACAIPPLIYVFDLSNFTTENLNGDVFGAIWLTLIMFAVAVAISFTRSIFQGLSVRRELALLKGLPTVKKGEAEQEDGENLLMGRSLIKVLGWFLTVCLAVLLLSVLAVITDSYTVPFWSRIALILCIGVPFALFVSVFYVLFFAKKWKNTFAKCVPVDGEKRSVWLVRTVLLALAAVMIVVGILNGGMGDVLAKAVRICTECIGLG